MLRRGRKSTFFVVFCSSAGHKHSLRSRRQALSSGARALTSLPRERALHDAREKTVGAQRFPPTSPVPAKAAGKRESASAGVGVRVRGGPGPVRPVHDQYAPPSPQCVHTLPGSPVSSLSLSQWNQWNQWNGPGGPSAGIPSAPVQPVGSPALLQFNQQTFSDTGGAGSLVPLGPVRLRRRQRRRRGRGFLLLYFSSQT